MRAACCEATVLRNEVIAPDIRLLTVVWPDRDHAPHAGQFFTLRSWGADEAPFLSRPYQRAPLEPGQQHHRVFVSGGGRGHRKAGAAQATGYLPAHRPYGQRL